MMKINNYTIEEIILKLHKTQKKFVKAIDRLNIAESYKYEIKTPVGDDISDFSEEYVLENITLYVQTDDDHICWKMRGFDYGEIHIEPDMHSGAFTLEQLEEIDVKKEIDKYLIRKLELEKSRYENALKDLEWKEGNIKKLEAVLNKIKENGTENNTDTGRV
nr:MAG TPA: hypothetical protein [Caudoviricetes sp.]